MLLYFVVEILFTLSSSLEIEEPDKDGSSASCATESWFLPGFAPYINPSWTSLHCSSKCSEEPLCKYWNWRAEAGCFLKTDKNPNPARQLTGKFIGGHRGCKPGDAPHPHSDDTPHGDSCLTTFWLVPGFAPLSNLTWSATDCSEACSSHETCAYWNWVAEMGCFLKTDKEPSNPARGFEGSGFVGGPKDCKPEAEEATLLIRAWANNFGSSNGNIPSRPPYGQRCSGRNYGERRCCSPQNPCGEGEGDCDGPGDGGQHDGHAGCRGSLVCGSNNCKKFGTYFHEKDDCCEKPHSSSQTEWGSSSGSSSNGWGSSSGSSSSEWGSSSGSSSSEWGSSSGSNGWGSSSGSSSNGWGSNVPSEPPYGQRCSGRNYGERRCCSPQNPCGEGEGDCDGPGDGGQHDGHAGCRGSLVCGSNNCKKFGSYFHEKDDCCERPNSSSGGSGGSGGSGSFGDGNWSNWSSWSQCDKRCGGGKKVRQRFCSGSGCNRQQQSQERNCNSHQCYGRK